MASTTYPINEGLQVLHGQRKALLALREAGKAMAFANLDTDAVREQIRALQANTVTISQNCILRCGNTVESTYEVDDPSNAYPNAALCGDCSGKLDDAAADAEAEIEGAAQHG